MLKSMRLNIVGVAVFALPLLLAFCGANGSAYMPHSMKMVRRGIRPTDSPMDMFSFLESFFNQREMPWEYDGDVEVLSPDGRDTEPVEADGDGTEIGDIDGNNDFAPMPVPGSFFNFFESLKPWYQGPNVCFEKKEINEDDNSNSDASAVDDKNFESRVRLHLSKCEDSGSTYTCTTRVRNNGMRKTFVATYRCCYGFKRNIGKPGCFKVNVKPMIETLEDLGAKSYAELVRTTGLSTKLSAENLTIFAPTDAAIRDFTDSLQAENQVEFYIPPGRSRRDTNHSEDELAPDSSMKQVALRHIVQGFHDVEDLVTDQVLYSDDRNLSLRFNVYNGIRQNQYPELGSRVMTINCAQLIAINHLAENGYVHVIDHVIRPATQTVGQLIAEDDNFSKFKQLLEKAEMLELLNEPGQLTIFAPTNAAFEKLDSALHSWLQSADSKTCLKNVLKHHMLNYLLCSCVVKYKGAIKTSLETFIDVDRSEDGKFLVDSGSQVVVPDVLGTNGVIHVIEEVLIPSSALPTTTVLEQKNLTQFASLLKETGLADVLNAADNMTLFAPTNDALSRPEAISAIQEARKNPEDLRNLLLFHTTKEKVHSCDMTNNKEVPTGFEGHSLRINLYSTSPFSLHGQRSTIQCARITNYDEDACGGLIHQVEDILIPPKLTALEMLESNGNFSTFVRLLRESNLISELKENSPFTILAPSDDAFARLTEIQMDEINSDKQTLTKLLRKHIFPEVLCCSGLRVAKWPFSSYLQSLAGPLGIRHDYEGHIHVGDTKITSCDHVATDGIVHFVNKVMLPMELKYVRAVGHGVKNPNVEVLLFGL